MIKIKIKSKKILNEASLSMEGFGLTVYQERNYHHLIFLDMNNFQQFVQEQLEKEPTDRLTTIPSIISDREFARRELKNPIVVGYIDLQNTGEDGPCFNALKVALAANHENYSGKGYGSHFYKIAMAYGASIGKPAIRPDINGPSTSAQRVWQSLERDGTVIKNFDQEGKPTTQPADPSDEFMEDGEQTDPEVMDRFDFTTPKKTVPYIDDCDPNRKADKGSFLSRAYASNMKAGEFKQLIDRADEFISDNFKWPENVYDRLYLVAAKLFDRRYDGS